MTEPHHRRGVFLVASAAMLWSTGGVVVRSLELADSWTTVFWRGSLAAVFLVLFVVVRERRNTLRSFRDIGWPGIAVAICYAIGSAALVIAFSLTSVANTLIIMSSSPFIAALLGRLVLAERVRPITWIAMAASMVGIGIMVSGPHATGSLAGDAVALSISVSQAIAAVIIRRHRAVRMAPAMFLSVVLTVILAAPLASPLMVTAGDMVLLTFFGAGQLGLGFALFSMGAPLIPVAQVALLNVLEPVFGPLWVWLALGEQPSDGALVGGAIVLAALAVNTLTDRGRA